MWKFQSGKIHKSTWQTPVYISGERGCTLNFYFPILKSNVSNTTIWLIAEFNMQKNCSTVSTYTFHKARPAGVIFYISVSAFYARVDTLLTPLS